MKLTELVKKRAAAFDVFNALAVKDVLTAEERTAYAAAKKDVTDLDDKITRAKEAQELEGTRAVPVRDSGVDFSSDALIVVEGDDPYVDEKAAERRGLKTSKGLRAIAALKMFSASGGNMREAGRISSERFGEKHPITRSFEGAIRIRSSERALIAGVGPSGGYIVPPDYVAEIIELLRPLAVVRASNPRVLPMPRGTLTLPGQASAATANYGTETGSITASQETLNEIVASYKKLTALVPVSNDLMRYSDPAVDAFVRDDLVKVLALREDLAFLLGDGLASSPRGFLSFANGWVLANGGTGGVWSTTGNSTYAVNGTDPANSTGGNFITSTEAYTLATVANELGGLMNRLDTANVPESRRMWFFHPRIKNYLYNVQNSLGVYVYRDEMNLGKLLGLPFKTTTQIGTNYHNANSSNNTGTFIFLAEMDEAMILDSMSLELFVSREGSYVDSGGSTVSAVQSDQTIIRAIAEHDFQLRHLQSVAIDQGVLWAPAIS
jgi:HK97 family phage major capsid protein